MSRFNEIAQRINENKALDFGTIFSDSFELFKKTWVQGFLHQIIIMFMMLPFIIAIYIPFIMLAFSQVGASDPYASDVYSTFLAGFSIGYILFFVIAMFLLGTLSLALNAGLYRVVKQMDYGYAFDIKEFFVFFKLRYLAKLLGIMFISGIIAIVAAMACYLPLFYVMVPLSFYMVFFAFNPEMGVGDIISLSFKFGTKKWLLGFGLLIVSSLLAWIIGLLLCGIGTLFTAAFVYHPLYLMYKDVIGFPEDDNLPEKVEFNYLG